MVQRNSPRRIAGLTTTEATRMLWLTQQGSRLPATTRGKISTMKCSSLQTRASKGSYWKDWLAKHGNLDRKCRPGDKDILICRPTACRAASTNQDS